MTKRIISLLAVLCLLFGLSVTVSAESYTGSDGWTVTFTAEGKMESHLPEKDGPQDFLQPGDDVTFEVEIINKYPETTEWYMTNEVLHSLEDYASSAKGGAYTYVLTYYGPGGEKTLFSSDTVGGDYISQAGEGLHEATDSLKDYFFLDKIEAGQSAKISLNVALDGETQGNDYQDTLADLQMNFAVQLETTKPDSPDVVKTGDETNLLPYFIAMGVSGMLFLVLAFDSIRLRRKERREAAE